MFHREMGDSTVLPGPDPPTGTFGLQLRKCWVQRSMTSPVTCGPWVSSCTSCECARERWGGGCWAGAAGWKEACTSLGQEEGAKVSIPFWMGFPWESPACLLLSMLIGFWYPSGGYKLINGQETVL